MSLTPSDVASLSKLLSRWEFAEYISAGLVTIACAGEYVADFTTWFTGGVKERKENLARTSTLLLMASLSLELVCLVKTNSLSGMLIGSLSEVAEEADNKARKAVTDSGIALAQAGEAIAKTRSAEASASRAQALARAAHQEADSVHQEIGRATDQLTQLEAQAQKTKSDLINLAVCNAPRVIPFWSVGNTKTSIDPLRPFGGRQAIIEFVPDAEARRAALNIAVSLDRAAWKIIKLSAIDGIEDGVEIQAYFKSPGAQKSVEEGQREWQIHLRSSEAVDALIDFLHSYNWQARMGWASPDANDIPPDGLKVRVGLYPAVTYVNPPGAKDLASAIAQFEQGREKSRQQKEKEQLKRDAEMLRHLRPQQAAEFKARREEWNKREQKWMERYSGPCQPLEPLSPSLR